MRKGHRIQERMPEHNHHSICPTPYQTIIEIAGAHRVLIENHAGVITYEKETVLIKVKYGFISVCGCNLEIMCMSRDQIVIQGEIQGVSLQRRTSG